MADGSGVNEDEDRVVMAAVMRDTKRAIFKRRLRLALDFGIVIVILCVLLTMLWQNLYQNNEIPFLRHPVYSYLAPYFGATPPNSGATFSSVWQPSPAGSSDLNMPVTLQLALYGPFPTEDASSPFIPGKHKPLVLSPAIHTSSWENQTYTAYLKVTPHLVPGYYLFLAISQNSSFGNSVIPDEVFLPCPRFDFGQGYPEGFGCISHES